MTAVARTARGYFAVGIWHPKHDQNIGTLWRSASSYGAAFVFTVGQRYVRQASDTCATPNHTPLLHFTDLGDLLRHLPHGCPLVGVELDPRATPLAAYGHRPRAAYLLGAEDHGLPPAVVDRCHDLIQVESPAPWSLNVSVAGSIVLRDRYVHGTVARRALAEASDAV